MCALGHFFYRRTLRASLDIRERQALKYGARISLRDLEIRGLPDEPRVGREPHDSEVAEHPPKHGKPGVYRHLEHVSARKHMQQMYRRLPDGRYVSVATVLIWEVEHRLGPHWGQFLRNR